MNIRGIILSVILFLSLPLFAQGSDDVIVMKNGDRFTCEIKGLSDGVLSVKLGYVDGTIEVAVVTSVADGEQTAVPHTDRRWSSLHGEIVGSRIIA